MLSRDKNPGKNSSDSSATPLRTGMFQSRPFTDPTVSDEVSPHKQELPDLQTQLERGARFSQSLSRMKVYGNRPAIQPKISVGAPGDKYEQEADQMAQQVMSMPAAISDPPIQRLEKQEEEKEPVQTKPLAASITPLVQRETAPPEELEEEQEPVQMKRSLQETAEVSIQRDGTDALPALPNYQLTPPSLLQPPDPSSRYGLGQNFQLHLDPQIQAMAFQHVQQQMEPATIRAALSQVNLGLTALPAPNASGPTATPTPNPFATPSPSPAAPLVPRDADPDTPRPATAGDLMKALLAVPAIDTWITTLQTRATEQMMRDWRRLSTGEQVGAVSSAVAIGAGALAGILSDPNARQMALSQLNGRVFPVPGLNWLSLEINTGGNNLMLGGHVDIGSLLPPSLGFGPSSAQPIGGPPTPQPFVPGQPSVQREVTPEAQEEKVQMKPLANAMIQRGAMPEEEEKVQTKPLLQRASEGDSHDASSNLESQLSSTKGEGSPLPDEVRSFMEPRFGADFSQVRVHTGSEAVQMNRELHSQAFTHGGDIYFGAGKSPAATNLTAHELTHVVQQTGAQLQRQQGVQEVTDSTRPSINMQSLPATSNAATSQNGGSSSEAESTWRDMGNLRGHPPVRSETNPPNKKVIEDEATYQQRRALAEQMLANQRQRAESMLDRQGNITDYRYWFAKVYSFVTDYELKFAESNTFYYPSYVMASVAYFEQIYNDNFNAFSNQGPVENHWRQAFEEAARQKQFTDMLQEQMMHPLTPEDPQGGAMAFLMQSVMGAVKSLVSSMQAHIRFDLPRAEAWVFNSYYSQYEGVNLADFRPDFMSMSGVFDNAARDMNQHMAQKLGVPVDLVPQLMQDTAMRQFFDADMATERADTWHRAEELVSSGNGGADPYRLQDGRLEGNVTQSDNLSGLNNLPTESMRPNMESSAPVLDDDEVCDHISQMSNSDITGLPATERMRMIRGLLRGATVGADESTILRILQASQGSGDVVTIIDGADAWDMMYSIDGNNATSLRNFFLQHYYAQTAQNTAMRLIRKCIEGETAEWEEQMVVDLLEKQPNRRSLIEQIGQIYQPDGPATGEDANFKNGLYKLEWQLDGTEEDRLQQLFGSSNQGWWNF